MFAHKEEYRNYSIEVLHTEDGYEAEVICMKTLVVVGNFNHKRSLQKVIDYCVDSIDTLLESVYR